MSDTFNKILGQQATSATTETDLYSPSPITSQGAVVSVLICNRSTATTFRVSVSQGGGSTANKDYLFYDAAIGDNETIILDAINIEANDMIRVYAGSANLSFSAIGFEVRK